MVSNKNSKVNVDVDGRGEIETIDVLRQGDIFIINRGEGEQLSIIRTENNSWSLVNGVADEESVKNIGTALTNHFGLNK